MKVLVIGSGPIVIGQSAEFDYAGTQACLALKDEGLEVVLVNNNPATIMTDIESNTRVYLEPLETESLEAIIQKEQPDALLATLGGQTALNLALKLHEKGVLERYNVKLLGTPLDAIIKAENRRLFKELAIKLDIPVPKSKVVTDIKEAVDFTSKIGFPLIVRPAFTLGGTGGGVAYDEKSLTSALYAGLKKSPISQVLLEQSLIGFKEIEFEVVRDKKNQMVTVCGLENIDPIGIHTGDSIVVAPIMTLTKKQLGILEDASHRLVEALQIEGACNVQLALHPQKDEYYVIEVNPRVSRSSALASKATGYPIAKVSALIALGKTLDGIKNPLTGYNWAAKTPKIDYVVCKFPRWPFDKFALGDRTLGTQMKATGEVMSVGANLEEAFAKALRSLELARAGFLDGPKYYVEKLAENLTITSDERFFYLAKALAGGMSIPEANRLTQIAPLFLKALQRIVLTEKSLSGNTLGELKSYGFSDQLLAKSLETTEQNIYEKRLDLNLKPQYRAIATQAGKREQSYSLYSTYNKVCNEKAFKVPAKKRPRALVIGSGPIRIGQGIEFDYCSVQAVRALQRFGWEAIIINNNPETVSTDFDTAERLYFEPLTKEDLLGVALSEEVDGVVVQFGGQTALNLARDLASSGFAVLGTATSAIDLCEDRGKCHALLDHLGIPQAEGSSAESLQNAMRIGLKLGFPLVVRPSYVIGGRFMEIVNTEEDLYKYLQFMPDISPENPVLLDRYLNGKELEVDAVSDGVNVIIPGIAEHVERAGIHSGDSILVYPATSITTKIEELVTRYTISICRAFGIRGVVNIQFIVYKGRVYVLEINPRASRTLPIFTKATGIPLVQLGVKVMLGGSLRENPYGLGLLPKKPYFAVKAPVFSFDKLKNVEVALGPEMRSTGEVLGLGKDLQSAMHKALLGSGISLMPGDQILARENSEMEPILKELRERGIRSKTFSSYLQGKSELESGFYDLLVAPEKSRDDFLLRQQAIEQGIKTLSSPDTLKALVLSLDAKEDKCVPLSLNEYLEGEPC